MYPITQLTLSQTMTSMPDVVFASQRQRLPLPFSRLPSTGNAPTEPLTEIILDRDVNVDAFLNKLSPHTPLKWRMSATTPQKENEPKTPKRQIVYYTNRRYQTPRPKRSILSYDSPTSQHTASTQKRPINTYMLTQPYSSLARSLPYEQAPEHLQHSRSSPKHRKRLSNLTPPKVPRLDLVSRSQHREAFRQMKGCCVSSDRLD
ncbi:hypothetical protein DL93DRAFT_251235 [Clavulina sp. PMI_390]|nr:hypothetical protein DL93DRAFT_251235 [Clavulina sp. PMI_390]